MGGWQALVIISSECNASVRKLAASQAGCLPISLDSCPGTPVQAQHAEAESEVHFLTAMQCSSYC
jgi:hypothetical protein